MACKTSSACLLWSTATGLGIFWATIAASQQTASLASATIQEVIVTATKRAEPLQKVPEAVSAISGDALQEMNATSFTDYARSVPSLSFTDAGNGREKLTLRGVNATAGADTVGYYIGETPITSISYATAAINPNLVDLDHVEVLRGPQGTLYGGQSIGGTIRLIPNAPNLSKVEGELQGTGLVTQGAHSAPGGYGDAVLNIPLIDGVAAVRGAAWVRDVEGFVDRSYGHIGNFGSSPHPVGTAKNVAQEHTWGFRGSALVRATEKLDITAMVYIQNQRFNGVEDITGGAMNPNNRLRQTFISNTPEPQRNQFSLYSLTANYAFGPVNLTSNTAYTENKIGISQEGTSTLQYFSIGPPFPNEANVKYNNYGFTHETRLATSDRIYGFDGVVGIFHSQTAGSWHFRWSPAEYNELATGNDPTNLNYAVDNNLFTGDLKGQFSRETSEFGELTYHFNEVLSATLGLRHYNNSNGGTTVSSGFFIGGVTNTTRTDSSSTGWVHKGNLSYQVTSDDLVYIQYAEGFRPGFGNGPLPSTCPQVPVPKEVSPDSVKNYEVGAKTAWLDKRLTINMALYRINWSNIQQATGFPNCGFGFNENFGDAVIKGAELEVNGRLTARVSAGLSGSYTQAELKQDTPVTANSIPSGFAGDQIEAVPVWQYAMYMMTSYPLLQDDDGYARVDYQYTGSSWSNYSRLTDGSRDPEVENQVTRLLNLRTGIKYGAWDFSLSATNVLNSIARQSLDPNAAVTFAIPGRPRYVVNRPRTFLVNAAYKF